MLDRRRGVGRVNRLMEKNEASGGVFNQRPRGTRLAHTTAPVFLPIEGDCLPCSSACAKARCIQSEGCGRWGAEQGLPASVCSSWNDMAPAERGEPIPQVPMLERIIIEPVSVSSATAGPRGVCWIWKRRMAGHYEAIGLSTC